MNDPIVSLPPYWIEETDIEFRGTAWGVDLLQAPAVWPKYTGKGVVYFVIDTEAGSVHPDVVPALEVDYCKNMTTETSNGLGHHGQHVAHTALQYAPGIRLGLVKALFDSGNGYSSTVANAILWVADLQLQPEHAGYRKVINLSLGSDNASAAIESALKYAILKKCFIVAAAGNGGDAVDFPGAYEQQAIAVGAIDQQLQVASFSDYGPALDLVAPGVSVPAAWGESGYATLRGTSMATPAAGGICALVLEAHPEIGTQSDMELFLEQYARKLEGERTGHGLPVATNYISMAEPEPEPPPIEQKPRGCLAIFGRRKK